MKRTCAIICVLLFGLFFTARSQNDSLSFRPQFRIGQNYSIFTNQGNVYTGYVFDESAEFVIIQNRLTHERNEIRKSTIVEAKRLREAPEMAAALPYSRHPQPRYYILSENALLFEPNTLCMNSHWLLLEKFDYAFNQNLDICMSTLAFYPYSLGLKTAFQLQKNDYVGGSVFGVGDIASSNKGSWFFGYGALARYTKGNENRSINLAGGFVGLNSDLLSFYSTRRLTHMLLLNAGLSTRFRETLAFTSEVWYLPALNLGLGGIAIKFISDEYNCWTLGCFAFINGNNDGIKINLKSLPLPYFGVSRKFN